MASRFWVGGTGTWDSTTTTHWAATTGGAGGASVPGGADTATFDGSSGGGTVTVDSTVNGATLVSLDMTAFTGTLDFSVNNPSLTFTSAFTAGSAGSAVRTLNLGSGTFSLSGAFGTWNASVVTGLTLNAGTSTIAFSATSGAGNRIFNGGGKTYSTVTVAAPTTYAGQAQFTLGQSNTIGTLNVGQGNVISVGSTTQTITNGFTFTGTATAPIIIIGAASSSGTISSANNGTINFGALAGLVFSGGGTFTANNSFGYNSTGITINAPAGGGAGIIGS